MPRSRPPYPPEFRRQMVELVRAGRSPESLSQEFEPSGQTIRNWVRQADIDEGRRSDGMTTVEWTEPENWEVEGRRLNHGTIALQAHDPDSEVHYKDIRIRLTD